MQLFFLSYMVGVTSLACVGQMNLHEGLQQGLGEYGPLWLAWRDSEEAFGFFFSCEFKELWPIKSSVEPVGVAHTFSPRTWEVTGKQACEFQNRQSYAEKQYLPPKCELWHTLNACNQQVCHKASSFGMN